MVSMLSIDALFTPVLPIYIYYITYIYITYIYIYIYIYIVEL